MRGCVSPGAEMKPRSLALAAIAVFLPALAAAQQASAINPVALRAGPDAGYPFVASYDAGTPLTVQGCIENYSWCDVSGPNGYRGWAQAGDIGYPYQQRQVPVLGYGAAIGIPVVAFALGPYWAAHYRHRPWYGERARWARFRPVVRPAAVVVRPAPAVVVRPAAVVVRPAAVVRPARRAVVVQPAPPPVAGGPVPPVDPAAAARGQ